EDGMVPVGEGEDYFMKLSKVGNLVWEDRDYDGIQDIDEPVIPGVRIVLDFYGIDTIPNGDDYEMTYETVTDSNGRYYFCGLIGNVDPSGIAKPTYKLTADDPEEMTATVNRDTFPARDTSNCVYYNSDGNDADIDDRLTAVEFAILNPMGLCQGELHPLGINDMTDSLVMAMMPDSNIWPDMQIDETLDFGYVAFDYGDLPDSTLMAGLRSAAIDSFNYRTVRDWFPGDPSTMGPRHAIQPKLYLGAGVDAELDGMPDLDAGTKTGGDDADTSAFVKGMGMDDESGIRLLSPLLPDEYAYIRVDYTAQDTLLAGGYVDTAAYLNAFIDWNGDGDFYVNGDPTMGFDEGEQIEFTHQGLVIDGISDITDTTNPLLPGGEDLYSILAFRVPDTSITTFHNGRAFMRFRLSFEGQLDPDNHRYHMDTPPHVVFDPVMVPADTAYNWVSDPLLAYPRGEVEDYAVPLAKVGNLAWFDHNVNGRQDSSIVDLYNHYRDEYGVDTLHLVLIWGGVNDSTGVFDSVGYFDASMSSAGDVTDIRYNLSIAPPSVGSYGPDTIKTDSFGLYSFRGLIPGTYNLIPRKYLSADSTEFVNYWPKHRALTVKNNEIITDSLDSDAGPGAIFTIGDINPSEPEVCVGDLPLGEDGQLDDADLNDPYFPDNQYDQTIDFGWVDEPNVEASLDLVGVDFPESETCGNMNLIMRLCLKNPQEVPLDSLVPFLNLKRAYGDAFYALTKPKVSIEELGYTTTPTVECEPDRIGMAGSVNDLTPFINSGYDGDADTILLTGEDVNTDFYLPGDSIVCIRIEFEIDPSFYDPANPWMSQGGTYGRAVGFTYDTTTTDPWAGGEMKTPLIDWMPKGADGNDNERFGKPIQVFDLSDEYDDPWPGPDPYPINGDGIQFEGAVIDRGLNDEYQIFPIPPSLTGRDKYLDEDDKTIQDDECWEKTQNIAAFDNVIISLDENCRAKLDPNMFISDHNDECGFDRYPEGSYYRVIIQDEHTGETLWASVDRDTFDAGQYLDRKLVFKARSVADHCTVVWGRITLEDKMPPIVDCIPDTDRPIGGDRILVCSDIDSVLNNASTWLNPNHPYYTGIATATDNCSEVFFDGATDVLEVLADCQESADNRYLYARIVRTFLFRDEYDNTANCRQVINFYRPEIILPECEIFLNNDIVGDDTDLTPEDMLGKYEQSESVPYYINAKGDRVYLTETSACGFAINYENTSFFDKEDCGYKLERTWSIFDWCYGTGSAYPDYLIKPSEDTACYDGVTWTGNSYGWTQLIVVGDTLAPIVSI
ncbi:MAG: SdrD B-like domain-containing protein, partial [Bacteroidota bacterium]